MIDLGAYSGSAYGNRGRMLGRAAY